MKSIKNFKKVVGVGLPALALAVVAGSGFATFYFAKDATKSQSENITIEGKAEASSDVSISGNASLTLDQGESAVAVADGITYAWGSLNATYNDNQPTDDTENNAFTVVRTYTITLNDTLDAYVTLMNGAEAVESVTGNWTDGTVPSDTITLHWKEGMKPQNATEYDAMVSALSGAQFTVEFSADVSDKVA